MNLRVRKELSVCVFYVLLTCIGVCQGSDAPESRIAQALAAAQQAERIQNYAEASRSYEEILKLEPNSALIHQSLAVTYHLQNRYRDAILEFQRAIQLDSSLWGSHLFLGMDLYKSNQFVQAIEPLKKSTSINPQMAEPEARFWLGVTYLALNSQEDAVRELRRDMELRPRDIDVLYWLTKAYEATAAAAFERLGRIAPGAAAVSLLQAERFTDENRADLAEVEYRNALWRRPDFAGWIPTLAQSKSSQKRPPELMICSSDARANLELASLFSNSGDIKRARSVLEQLAEQKGADTKASEFIDVAKKKLGSGLDSQARPAHASPSETVKGIELLMQGRPHEAASQLAQVTDKDPSLYLRSYLARAYLESEEYAHAEPILLQLLSADPENVDALHMLGRNYKGQATQLLQQMIELDPDSYGVHELRGQRYDERTEYDAAIKEYQAALAKRPSVAGVRYAIGNVYRKMHNYEQAEHWLSEELKNNPYHGLAHYRLGSICLEENKPAEAISQLEQALQSHPELVDARVDLGRAYMAMGRLSDASGELKKVAAADPDNDRVHYLLSNVYAKQGNKTEADIELATYQRLTRTRLKRTQEDINSASDAIGSH
jgi:tetratricopeptide (TPR) repeat protein